MDPEVIAAEDAAYAAECRYIDADITDARRNLAIALARRKATDARHGLTLARRREFAPNKTADADRRWHEFDKRRGDVAIAEAALVQASRAYGVLLDRPRVYDPSLIGAHHQTARAAREAFSRANDRALARLDDECGAA